MMNYIISTCIYITFMMVLVSETSDSGLCLYIVIWDYFIRKKLQLCPYDFRPNFSQTSRVSWSVMCCQALAYELNDCFRLV